MATANNYQLLGTGYDKVKNKVQLNVDLMKAALMKKLLFLILTGREGRERERWPLECVGGI